MAKAIMVQGTASNVGKSVLVAALCRILHQDGYRVAPFKAQNMALNSFITKDGYEIGRAQAMQAEAAGVAPDVRMNPILLKPTSDMGSQVIVNGRATGNQRAEAYFREKRALLPAVKAAYESLAKEFDYIVIEGAGSPAEINLKADDFVNMGMAAIADAPVLLVGDIDRGGVFAALYGTIALLTKQEQDRICGLIINKFRGNLDILKSGLTMIEDLTGKPVLGTVPYFQLDLDDEDSLSEKIKTQSPSFIHVVVPKLPRISNFTDLAPLEHFSFVSVSYASTPAEILKADMIVLPGSKNTMDDLRWLRQNGMEAAIIKKASRGTPVFGICGGYQMMGQKISDPFHVEHGGEMEGMGLLPVETVFEKNKETCQSTGTFCQLEGMFSALSTLPVYGYEIHMGKSIRKDGQPLLHMDDSAESREEGCRLDNCYGTYLHGLFDSAPVTDAIIHALLHQKGIDQEIAQSMDAGAYRQTQYDKLAALVRNALDMPQIYKILNGE